ncbi:uncharacterized protein B0T15DRAFT_754 [Chaetomium strumarium]|uniref:Uncharacterized protein n=1 Tax=Chaetomium strumarium TaxID=1170767 RepID=A0AAJ0M588_9PEZI|nr:hypothetical protein B0T15DRAFT_754 [Chaetomium strumarium]
MLNSVVVSLSLSLSLSLLLAGSSVAGPITRMRSQECGSSWASKFFHVFNVPVVPRPCVPEPQRFTISCLSTKFCASSFTLQNDIETSYDNTMTASSPLPRALLLVAVLVTAAANGNPIDMAAASPRGDTEITPCATFKCTRDTVCKVVDGQYAQCVPIIITAGVPCGNNTVCEAGESCCNPSCGLCVKPGMACTAHICPPGPSIPVTPPDDDNNNNNNNNNGTTTTPPTQCGSTQCKPGLECCNPSCGICVEPGKGCTKQLCPPKKGEPCGKTVCQAGLICCNASCGVCTAPGMACTQHACED